MNDEAIFSFLQYREKNPTQVIDLSQKEHRDRVISSIGFAGERAAQSRVIRLFRILILWNTNSKAILEDNAARGAFIALTSMIINDGTEIIAEDGDINAIFHENSQPSDFNADIFDILK